MHIRPVPSSCNSVTSNATMDTIYPEPMSLLHRRVVPKKRRGKTSRYRTQPVTFSEIQEVDEDNLDETIESTVAVSSRSEQDINRRFEEFIKRREKILDQIDRPTMPVVDENSNPTTTKNNVAITTTTTTIQTNQRLSRPSI